MTIFVWTKMKWFVFICFFLENPIFSTDINVAFYQDQCLFLESYALMPKVVYLCTCKVAMTSEKPRKSMCF